MSILYRTTTGSNTEQQRQQSTFSCWVKRGKLGANQNIMDWHMNSGDFHFNIVFKTDDSFQLQDRDNGVVRLNFITNRKFRDVNSWYHIMVNLATNQGTQSNRVKIYINGVQETSFATSSYPSQDTALQINKVVENCRIGGDSDGGNLFGGSLSALYWVAGSSGQYAGTIPVSTFGETDTDTGEWRPKNNPSISAYGDNGFFMKFENSGNIDLDSSSNNYSFTATAGAVTQTKDSPNNVMATLNPLDNFYANATFSYGNTQIVSPSGREASSSSTLAMTKGKFYWETKFLSSNAPFVGIQPIPSFNNTASPACLQLHGLGLLTTGKVETTNGSGGSVVLASYATYTTNDIIGVALDLDASQKKIYFYKNGSILGASGVNITDPASTRDGHYMVAVGNISGSDTIAVNFGNGYFATTAITTNSGNGYAGAEGASKFAYQPRSGHSALSTKGLNQ